MDGRHSGQVGREIDETLWIGFLPRGVTASCLDANQTTKHRNYVYRLDPVLLTASKACDELRGDTSAGVISFTAPGPHAFAGAGASGSAIGGFVIARLGYPKSLGPAFHRRERRRSFAPRRNVGKLDEPHEYPGEIESGTRPLAQGAARAKNRPRRCSFPRAKKLLTIRGICGREMFETWRKMVAMPQSGLEAPNVITHQMSARDFRSAFEIMRTRQSARSGSIGPTSEA